MASKVKEKAADMGHAVADTAKTVGHKIAEGAEKAVDFIKEKTGMGEHPCGNSTGIAGIKDHMDVIASCGSKVGVVDHVEGGRSNSPGTPASMVSTTSSRPHGSSGLTLTSTSRRTPRRPSKAGRRTQRPADAAADRSGPSCAGSRRTAR